MGCFNRHFRPWKRRQAERKQHFQPDEGTSRPQDNQALFKSTQTPVPSTSAAPPDTLRESAQLGQGDTRNSTETPVPSTSASPPDIPSEGAEQQSPQDDTNKLTQTPVPSTCAVLPESLWETAARELAQDDTNKHILKEATKIVGEFGLDFTNGSPDRQQLCEFLDTKVRDLEQKKWMVHVGHHETGVQDKLRRFFQNILKVQDVLKAVAAASPPAAIVCAGMTVSLLLFVEAVEQHGSLLDGLEYTSTLIPRLCFMEHHHLRPGVNHDKGLIDGFTRTLTSLYAKILELQARAVCYLRKRSFSQFTRNMLNRDCWDTLLNNIKGDDDRLQKLAFSMEAQQIASGFESLQEESTRRQEALQETLNRYQMWKIASVQDEKIKNFLQRLYTCPYRERKNRNEDRVPGTCEWFTSHRLFQDWNQQDDSCILWVSAAPGCGKSVLARYLIDDVLPDPTKRTICYFFFNDDFPDQRTSASALCCLLRQLFMARPSLISGSILDQVDTDGNTLFRSFHDLWGIFTSAATNPEAGEIVCVIDALDECQNDDERQMLGAVTNFYLGSSRKGQLKFLITGRPYRRIYTGFRGLQKRMPSIHLSGEGEAEVSQISREIDLVIKKRVEDIADAMLLEEEEKDFLWRELTAVPHRTYLWVSLTLDLIEKLPSFTKEQLCRRIRDQIPRTVEEAYNKMLNQSPDHAKAKKLLQFVTAAKRPLRLEELRLAMALKTKSQSEQDVMDDLEPLERFKVTIRDLCGLLLVIVDDRIFLLHQTVKEYLVKHTDDRSLFEPGNWMHSLDPIESHQEIAATCISYLHSGLSETCLDNLRDYAACFWPVHFNEACFHLYDEIGRMAHTLCNPEMDKFKIWSPIYKIKVAKLPSGRAPLLVASSLGLHVLVDHLLRTDTDVDPKDSEERTPLSWAAGNGHDGVVKMLLGTGKVDVNAKDSSTFTPLLWAVFYRHHAVIRILLESEKLNVNAKDCMENAPLTLAVIHDDDIVVKMLLDTGKVDVNPKDRFKRTPLLWAAGLGLDTMVELLLDNRDVDINARDSHQRTPLLRAARYGHDIAVKMLLNTGKVDVNARDDQNRTALVLAAEEGHDSVVKMLCKTGKLDFGIKESE